MQVRSHPARFNRTLVELKYTYHVVVDKTGKVLIVP